MEMASNLSNNELQKLYLSTAFTLGESLITTIRSEYGFMFYLQDHILRLKASCKGILKRNFDLEKEILRGLKELAGPDQVGKVRISVFVLFDKLRYIATYEKVDELKKPISLRTTKAIKLYPPFAKVSHYLPNLYDFNPLYINEKESILEAKTANIFFMKHKTVFTPPLQEGVLDGITRKHLIKCLKENDWRVKEINLNVNDLNEMSCAFQTSSIQEIIPVSKINVMTFKNLEIEKIKNQYRNYKDKWKVLYENQMPKLQKISQL